MVGMASKVTDPPMQIVEFQSHMQIVEKETSRQGTHGHPIVQQNYILQDDDDDEPQNRYNARSRATSIMQEAMLACIDITKPTFKISAAKLATQKFPMIWFCKMADSILSKQGKLFEYCHLIATPRQGPYGPTLTSMSFDGLRKDCPAE
jgi:hypothetical protein